MKALRLHIICEKDVGLFSLVQQVVSHIPEAIHHERTPVVFFEKNCCYWIEGGYENRDNVWEYYFEPLVPKQGSDVIPSHVKTYIRSHFPNHTQHGHQYDANTFVSNHFGHHAFLEHTLPIPWSWEDPTVSIRKQAAGIIKEYITPRPYLLAKANSFYQKHLSSHFILGVHIRGTDVTDKNEYNIHRRGSYSLKRYQIAIAKKRKEFPNAKVLVATDSSIALERMKMQWGDQVIHYSSIFHTSGAVAGKGPSGWTIPAYISTSPEIAAKNGEEAVIDYLLLTRCNFLIHSGSGLPRTALLSNPDLAHFNIHSKKNFLKSMFSSNGGLFYLIKSYAVNLYRSWRTKIGCF